MVTSSEENFFENQPLFCFNLDIHIQIPDKTCPD